MNALFANNASSRMPDDLGSSASSVLVWPGEGAKFPQPTGTDYFMVTLEDRRTGQIEICRCTGRSGDMLMLTRAQEGTVAQDFHMGATVSNRMTAGALMSIFSYTWSKQEADDRFVNVDGDTMTGELSIPLVPTAPEHATSKSYVDTQIGLIDGVAEPPNDGKDYARRYGQWTVTISKATFDSTVARIDAKDAAQDVTLGQHTSGIAKNTADIAKNTADITANAANIASNASDIVAIEGINGQQDVAITNLQNGKVNKAGDTMTGPLVIPGPPNANGQAANKKYVDDAVATVNAFPEAPMDGRQYARQMAAWSKVQVVGTTSTGDKPPTALLEPGQMWFETDTGSLFIWYDDGNSQQWVQINTAARSSGGDVPPGTVVDFAGDIAPTGWMFCFGQLMSIVLYPALYKNIGTLHGGDGVTTFGLPDCRDRTTVGKGDMGGAAANRITTALSGFDSKKVGSVGGSEGIILDLTMIPSHAHTGGTGVNNVDHTHPFSGNTGYISSDHAHNVGIGSGGMSSNHLHTASGNGRNLMERVGGAGGTGTNGGGLGDVAGVTWGDRDHSHGVNGGTSGVTANHYHAFSGSTGGANTNHSHVITAEGGGLAHQNVQPTIVFNKIIKV